MISGSDRPVQARRRPSAQVRAGTWGKASPLLLTIVLSCPEATALEQDAMAPVMVGDLSLAPGGNLRDAEHRFELHPKALLGSGWNSTAVVPPAGDGSPDYYAHALAGMLLRYHPRLGLDLEIDGELQQQRYESNPVLDTRGGLLWARIDRVAPELSWHGDGGWRRYQEALQSTGELVVQDHYQLRGRIAHDSPFWWESADAAVSILDYRQGTSTFDERQGDHVTGDVGVRVGIADGDDRGFLSLRGQMVRYAQADRFNDCTAFTLSAGGLITASPRSNLQLEAGVEMRRYAADYLHDAANDDSEALAPWCDLRGTWSWREGNRLGARLYSDLTDSITSNATWSLGAEVSGRIQLSGRCSTEASAGLSENRDGGITSSGATVQRQIAQGSLAGQYALAEGLAARLRATVNQVSSSADDGYDRLIIGLDLAYTY